MWYANFRYNRKTELATILGASASVVGLIISLFLCVEQWSGWLIAVIATAVIFTVVLAITAFYKPDRATRRYNLNDTKGINKYLFDWIDKGGRVAIWTRDMSWVDQYEMMPMLRKKAGKNELIICLPRHIEKSRELEQYGAEVIDYGILDTHSVTFTIVNYKHAGSRVAVGRRSGDKHIIQEFSPEEHPAFHLAYDLVQLARGGDNAAE